MPLNNDKLDAQKAAKASDEPVDDAVALAEWDSDEEDSLTTITYESCVPHQPHGPLFPFSFLVFRVCFYLTSRRRTSSVLWALHPSEHAASPPPMSMNLC